MWGANGGWKLLQHTKRTLDKSTQTKRQDKLVSYLRKTKTVLSSEQFTLSLMEGEGYKWSQDTPYREHAVEIAVYLF